MLEEFGSKIELIKNKYIDQSFKYCFQNNISIAILWNWGPGGGFDVFSYMTSLMNIIHRHARRWGHEEKFQNLHKITYVGNQSINGIAKFHPMIGDPRYGGQLTM